MELEVLWSYVFMVRQGFEDHVKHDHNMWMYVYFSIYLDTIDISDHNAIEKYVYEMVSTFNLSACLQEIWSCSTLSSQIKERSFEFFPLFQARCLETEEDETAKQLEALCSKVTSVLERFKEEVAILPSTGSSKSTVS